MSLNDQQKRAVRRAREALYTADAGRAPEGVTFKDAADASAFWRGWLDRTLTDLLAELEDDEEPVPHEFPAAYHAPWEPGDCTCGGHVTRDGVFHAAGAA